MVGFPFALPLGPVAPAGLPSPGLPQLQLQVHFLQKTIQGCEFHAGSAAFEVVLGMDVLSIGSLVVQGNGTFSFSF